MTRNRRTSEPLRAGAGLSGEHELLGVPCHVRGAAVDVEGEESRGLAGGALRETDNGPDDVSVGVREWEGVDLLVCVPVKAAFVHVVGDDRNRLGDAEVKEEPMGFAFVGAFGDEPLEVEVGEFDAEAGFFEDLALGAVRGGFAGVDVELAADGRAQAEVGGLDAFEEEDAAVHVAEVAEAGEAVGEIGGIEHARG